MTRCEGRAPAFLAIALSTCLALSACSTPEPEEGPVSGHVPHSWLDREVTLRTLDRMLSENDPDEVVENIGDNRELLFETRVLQQSEGEYRLELDVDEWRTESVTGLGQIDAVLSDAVYFNEVTWCGEPVNGEEFVDTYIDEFWETLESFEEYEASVADYVDCGTGGLD